MDNLSAKGVSNVVVVCATVVLLAFIGGMVLLTYVDKDADALSRLLNTLLNAIGAFAGTGALIYASSASKKATQAADQTNGTLDERIQANVHKALNVAAASNTAVINEVKGQNSG